MGMVYVPTVHLVDFYMVNVGKYTSIYMDLMGDRYWVCCISDAILLVMVYNQQFHGTILLMFERSRKYVLLKT